MDRINFDFKNTNIKDEEFKKLKDKSNLIITDLNEASQNGFDCKEASINLIDDDVIIKESKFVVDRVNDAKVIVVIGIGGSNLGTIAVYEALKGKYYNQLENKKVYFADTTDANKLSSILILLKEHVKRKEKIVLNVISKSGGTTETIANFEILVDFLKKHQLNYQKYVVVTTERDSKLFNLAKKYNYNILTLERNVGGRYSVFSNVGIFPLTFLGVNVGKLIEGAKTMKDISLSKDYKKNPALRTAMVLYINYKKKINIVNSFFFSEQLESLGKWYRQLLGESIGKEFNLKGKKVCVGLTPITSIGSTDLHSMGQLFLGGPNDKFHIVVEIEEVPKIKIPNKKEFNGIVENIQKIPLDNIMKSIIKGIQGSFKKRKIPSMTISLKSTSEFEIGAFMQLKMFEIIILGNLLEINPFDQPNVEEYKIITKKLLSK